MKTVSIDVIKALAKAGVTGLLFAVSVLLPDYSAFAGGLATDSVYEHVDKHAVFKGSPRNRGRFIETHINYPKEAWLNCTEGTVMVSAVVTKDGALMNVAVDSGVEPLLDMEAMRVVELMQQWRPARMDGKAVHSRISIPVVFALGREQKEFVQMLNKYGLTGKMPLYVVDGRVVTGQLEIADYNLKSLRVIKGEKAIERYGEKAKNGAVVITTKRGTPPMW